MPLLRIEVSNFKSYRGHQVIGPFKNFTSVIGPNGSGKSNLMDAISFVLGVKSAQLRSSQLRDLVYRGRRLAKLGEDGQELEVEDDGEEDGDEDQGEGSAKKAWVLAVYHGKDGNQYLFQRTISITGSSEYRLNGRVVTYQTYNQTLEEHDILVKAKNFLVFQGDVEAVASQSPKDLARLIEQISGSLELAPEYERAKGAMERATEAATLNYTKQRTMNTERKLLDDQKKEAQSFQDACQERDELVIKKLLWRLFHIEENITHNTKEINTKNRELTKLRKQLSEYNKQLSKARSEQAAAKGEVMKKEQAIQKAEKTLEIKRPRLVEAETQIAHSERKAEKAVKMMESTVKEVQAQEAQLERLKDDRDVVQREADAAEAAQREASQESLALSEENLAEYHALKAQSATQAVEERQRLEALARDQKTQSRALSTLSDKLEQKQAERTKLLEDLKSVESLHINAEEKVAELRENLNKTKLDLNLLQDEKERISTLEKELNEKLNDIFRKLMDADVDRKENEREVRMKETFTTLARIFPGVRGRVLDLCKPTHRKFELAVTIILGRNLDALVVDQEKTAIECIEYMRSQRAGQATFIPLDTIQVTPVNEKYRNFAKGARLAIDVIQFDPSLERAFQYACGNALVCDTLDIARYICYEKGQEVKAVTLDGTVLSKNGSMTGGRSTRDTGRKWDEQEIQGLQRVKETHLAQLRDLMKVRPRPQVEEGFIEEIQRLESSLTVADDTLQALTLRLTGVQDELNHVNSQIEEQTPQYETAREALDELEDQMAEVQTTVDAADHTIFAAFCRKIRVKNIREYEERQLKALQDASEARTRFNVQLNRLTHQIEFAESTLKATKERLTTLQKTLSTERKAVKELEKVKGARQTELATLQENINTLKIEREEQVKFLEEKTQRLDDIKRTTSKANKGFDTLVKEIASMNDEIERLASERFSIYRKCKLEEIDLPVQEGNGLDNVPIEEDPESMAMDIDVDEDGIQRPLEPPDYGVEADFESLNNEDKEDGSAEYGAKIDTDIAKLVAQIEQMMPNMKAMARLDDVEQRLNETSKEAEKARKEVKAARDAFNAIKKKRSDLFNQAYDHISERIDQVYKDLTKGKAAPAGGVAYLSLEDSEEPYNSGIKYHAMPPMKRFRDMDQLSGGEKTVAALALLFAIHSYRPSPFFVLDEVDAALDNTNVAKIANYIRAQASDDFQFIVISLKGSLYERGNSLVGIYRDQDVNSSKTLTLDLTFYDE